MADRIIRDVQFEFLTAAEAAFSLRGSVVTRQGEMILDVELPGERPYLIQGIARDGFFEGVHKGLPGDTRVRAKWIALDGIWIGTWIEDGIDYVLMFRLPL